MADFSEVIALIDSATEQDLESVVVEMLEMEKRYSWLKRLRSVLESKLGGTRVEPHAQVPAELDGGDRPRGLSGSAVLFDAGTVTGEYRRRVFEHILANGPMAQRDLVGLGIPVGSMTNVVSHRAFSRGEDGLVRVV